MSSFILLNPVSLQPRTTSRMLLITVSEVYLTSIAPQGPTPSFQMTLCEVGIFSD